MHLKGGFAENLMNVLQVLEFCGDQIVHSLFLQ